MPGRIKMTTYTSSPGKASTPPHGPAHQPGPLGRLGLWVTTHARFTWIIWALLIVGLGAFAPKVEHNLSGAGWQAYGSESVVTRDLVEEHFGGLASHAIQVVIHSTDGPVTKGEGPRSSPR